MTEAWIVDRNQAMQANIEHLKAERLKAEKISWEATAFLMTNKPAVASSGACTWAKVMRWVEGYAQAAASDTLDRIEIQRKPGLR